MEAEISSEKLLKKRANVDDLRRALRIAVDTYKSDLVNSGSLCSLFSGVLERLPPSGKIGYRTFMQLVNEQCGIMKETYENVAQFQPKTSQSQEILQMIPQDVAELLFRSALGQTVGVEIIR